jgi:hypothetical protein
VGPRRRKKSAKTLVPLPLGPSLETNLLRPGQGVALILLREAKGFRVLKRENQKFVNGAYGSLYRPNTSSGDENFPLNIFLASLSF